MTEQEKTHADVVRQEADRAIAGLPENMIRAQVVMTTLGQYMAHDIMSGVLNESTVLYASEFYRVHSAVRLINTLTELVES